MVSWTLLLLVLSVFTLPTYAIAGEHPKDIIHEKDASSMILIPGGSLKMGYKGWHGDSMPLHTVLLDPFYIDKFEVTNRQYLSFVQATGHGSPTHSSDPSYDLWDENTVSLDILEQPVINVSWYDATAYAKWAGKRLPTEAEWEFAARGTTSRIYPWGDTPPKTDLNCCLPWQGKMTYTAVGTTSNSTFGVMGLGGNVAEWVFDFYDPWYYSKTGDGQRNPRGPETGSYRVVRGGSSQNAWYYFRCGFRDYDYPHDRSNKVGFRCAKSP